jgi:hypothetical protein
VPQAGGRDGLLDEHVEIARIAELRREPAQLALHGVALFVRDHMPEDRQRGPQAPHGDTHLMHRLGITRLAQDGLVREEVVEAGEADELEALASAHARLEPRRLRLDGLLAPLSGAQGEPGLGFAPLIRAAAGRPVRHPTLSLPRS